MKQSYDAIIVGAGIIGCSVAFELAKKGKKTLNIDKLGSSGHGSTSNSCAIIRLHYSTPDGVAMAREGYYYWLKWPQYLEVEDPAGMARYVNTGCLVIKTALNKNLKNVMASLDDMGVDYEELDLEGIKQKLPLLDLQTFFPAKLLNDPQFGQPTGERIAGAIFVPESGYVTDPQLSTHNVQVAAEAKGAQFLKRRPRGRRQIKRRLGNLCPGGRQRRRTAFLPYQPHGRCGERHADQNPGAAPGSLPRAGPRGDRL